MAAMVQARHNNNFYIPNNIILLSIIFNKVIQRQAYGLTSPVNRFLRLFFFPHSMLSINWQKIGKQQHSTVIHYNHAIMLFTYAILAMKSHIPIHVCIYDKI
jgi:hypothetical protein